jgi:hypothetical protein
MTGALRRSRKRIQPNKAAKAGVRFASKVALVTVVSPNAAAQSETSMPNRIPANRIHPVCRALGIGRATAAHRARIGSARRNRQKLEACGPSSESLIAIGDSPKSAPPVNAASAAFPCPE